MKKKILAGILAMTLTTGAVAVPDNENTFLSAEAVTSDGYSDTQVYNDFEYCINYNTNTAIISAYKGTNSTVTFPSSIGKYKVTAIGIDKKEVMSDEAKKVVKKIYISEGIKIISKSAFSSSSSLQEVHLPSTLETIDAYAFSSCYYLEKINFPSKLKNICKYAFSYCYELTSVEIPRSLVKLEKGAFYCCQSIKKVLFPSNIKTIPTTCFYECYDLEEVVIENGVTTIGEYAFSGCSRLKVVKFPSSLTTICEAAFCQCDVLSSANLSGAIKEIQAEAFFQCYNLKSVVFSKNLTYIGSRAFYSCVDLTEVKMFDNIKYIEEEAFYNCEKLTGITLPIGIKDIGFSAFGYNYNSNLFKTENFAIQGYAGTAAQTYADENGIRFVNMQRDISKAKFTLNANGLVTVKYGNTVLKKNTDYIIAGRHNKKTGKYTVTVKGKGMYKGTASKSFTVKPAAQKITKVVKLKKAVKVYYRKNSSATGYKIQLASNKKFSKARTYKLRKKYSAKTIKKLKSGKVYYVRVQSYRIIGKTVYYGNWSKIKAVKTK